ncbi:hypothetical protein LXA47_21010 [Massilia sp. P8910]|nr:hypothetical protein [Massilia antarctica]
MRLLRLRRRRLRLRLHLWLRLRLRLRLRLHLSAISHTFGARSARVQHTKWACRRQALLPGRSASPIGAALALDGAP